MIDNSLLNSDLTLKQCYLFLKELNIVVRVTLFRPRLFELPIKEVCRKGIHISKFCSVRISKKSNDDAYFATKMVVLGLRLSCRKIFVNFFENLVKCLFLDGNVKEQQRPGFYDFFRK